MPQLVLTRKPEEKVRLRIGNVLVWVTVLHVDRNKVRLGFEAPPEVEVHREEVVRRIEPKPAS